MQPCFFDITDAVKFAGSNPRVSGIQRVQLNLVADMARRFGPENVQCIFLHPATGRMLAFDPLGVIDETFDTGVLLRRLGVIAQGSRLPDPRIVREYLRPYDRRKVIRALIKIGIYIRAYLNPAALQSMGLRLPTDQERAIQVVPLTPVDRLSPEATLVVLGASWNHPRLEAFTKAHAQAGGDVVQMVYDLIPIVAPQFFNRRLRDQFSAWMTRISAYTRRYLCISEWTASDLRRFLGEQSEAVQIRAVPLAHEMFGFARNDRATALTDALREVTTKPYVLCVGTLEVRKNGTALLDAWMHLISELGEATPRLVFAGRMGWLMDEFNARLTAHPELRDDVRIVESPSDTELAALYQNSLFTAYPSLYEGWGLPVGESAWFGKYCISSHCSSLPEVCGDLIDYVDPTNGSELVAALRRAITQPEYVADREHRISQAPLRTWSDVSEQIYHWVRNPAHTPA